MGLVIKEQVDCGTFLGVWRIEEELDFLLDVFPLKADEMEMFNHITNPSRQKEWIISRILLTELAEKRISIYYSVHGKPFLTNCSEQISISHSRKYVACLLSNRKNVGIDIEIINHRAAKVGHKYLTQNEIKWCKTDVEYTLIWSVKEAVFKLYEKELDFQEMEINNAVPKGERGQFKVVVNKDNIIKSHICQYRVFDDQMLTLVVENDS